MANQKMDLKTNWTPAMLNDLQKCRDRAKSRKASLSGSGTSVGAFPRLLSDEWRKIRPLCTISEKALQARLYVLEHPRKPRKFDRKSKVASGTTGSLSSLRVHNPQRSHNPKIKDHTKWTSQMLSDLLKCKDRARNRQVALRKAGKKGSFQALLSEEWKRMYPQYPHSGARLTTRLYCLEHKPPRNCPLKSKPIRTNTNTQAAEKDGVSKRSTVSSGLTGGYLGRSARHAAGFSTKRYRNINSGKSGHKYTAKVSSSSTDSKQDPTNLASAGDALNVSETNKASSSTSVSDKGDIKSTPKYKSDRSTRSSTPDKTGEAHVEDRKTTWTRQMLDDLVSCRNRAKAEQAVLKQSGIRRSYQNILVDFWSQQYPEFKHDRGLLVTRLYNLEHPRHRRKPSDGAPGSEKGVDDIDACNKRLSAGSDLDGPTGTPHTSPSTPIPQELERDIDHRSPPEYSPDTTPHTPVSADVPVRPGRMTPHERNMTSEISRKWRPITGIALSPSKGLPDINVKLQDVNPLLTCGLCHGYLISATTITDCLHSFCKSCIVRHVEIVSVNCPSCGIMIHPSNPYQSMRLDCTIQDIIFKLLPHLEVEEKRREREFYVNRGLQYPPPKPQVEPTPPPPKRKKLRTSASRSTSPAPIEYVSIHLEHAGSAKGTGALRVLTKNYIRVTSQATVGHLQRLLDFKLNANHLGQLSLFVDSYLLHSSLTLHDVKDLFFEDSEEVMTIQYGIMPIRDFFAMDAKIVDSSSDDEEMVDMEVGDDDEEYLP